MQAGIVSAVLPAFNSKRFISRAIDSVLSQQGEHLRELIIVDDCSADDTLAFVRSGYGSDKRVRILSTGRNSGPGPARNLAIAAATGEWIAPIDADDAWVPDRLSRLLDEAEDQPDLIFDNLICYDHKARVETGAMFPKMPDSMSLVEMAAEKAPGTTFNFGYLKPLIRTSFLKRSGVLYLDARISEDLLFYLELIAAGATSKTSAAAYYIYTTPFGQCSGRRSSASSSIPNDASVADMLDNFVVQYEGRLNASEVEAISRRAACLRESAPLLQLYESWTRRRYVGFAWKFLADANARRALIRKLRDRRGSTAC